MVGDAAGPAPQGGRDPAEADAGRRHANTQIHASIAEPQECRPRGANPETVPAVMPHGRVWVAEMALDSRSQTSPTILKTDRRPKSD